jgi:hypothetical protein
MKAEELVLNSVSYFNHLMTDKKYNAQLKDNGQLYRLHIAKKNGEPKDDLPRNL